jgi:alpha-glucosidase
LDYVATVYADGDGADYRNHPTALRITREHVNAGTTKTLRLTPGGGQAIHLRPADG